ncbi:MAG: hypothetical protein ACLT23_00200 [Lachnospiraceae bacterium]
MAIMKFEMVSQGNGKASLEANRNLGKLYLGIHPTAYDLVDVDLKKALFHLERSKELGVEDVDDFIERANKQIKK